MEKTTHERVRPYRFLLVAPALIGGLALSGCTEEMQAYNRGDVLHLTPADRYSYDYFSGNTGTKCLYDTAFSYGYDGATLSFDKETGILDVTAKNGVVLSLEGFDQAKTTVKPANTASQNIFDSYGCVVESEQ